MITRAALILAVALPLGLCGVVFFSMAAILQRRLAHHRYRHQQDSENASGRIKELQQTIEKLPKLPGTDEYMNTGVLEGELLESYQDAYYSPTALQKYFTKWIPYDKNAAPIPNEVSRLEAILFPKSSAAESADDDMAFKFFPNPQQYTAAEIVDRLHTPFRWHMFRHIMVSILLENTSIRGYRHRTLLPLTAPDIMGLCNLADAVRNGLELDSRLSVHISKFGLYQALRLEPHYCTWEPYHTFFEALFQPYFIANSPEDVAARRTDLNEAISAAVAHGMTCLGSVGQIEYKWCNKIAHMEVAPAMLEMLFDSVNRKPYTKVIVECLSLK